MTITTQSADGTQHQFPDGTDPAVVDKVMKAYAMQSSAPPTQPGPQPTLLDRAIASPIGRGVQNLLISPLLGMNSLITKGVTMGLLGDRDPYTQAAKAENNLFQGSIQKNQNTPGYADQRAIADKVMQDRGGSGFTDQMTSGFNPSLAGLSGLLSSGASAIAPPDKQTAYQKAHPLLSTLDASNAMADAQQQGQDAYSSKHPIMSTAASLLGGLASGRPMAGSESPIAASISRDMATKTVDPNMAGATDYVQSLMSGSKTAPDANALRTIGQSTTKPITTAEAIGKPAEVGLGALARRPGETADAMAAQISGRTADMPERILGDFADASGIDPAAARGDIQTLVQNGRARAAPLYESAYDSPPATSDRLQQFSSEPVVQQGMKRGIKIARLQALAEGKSFDPNAYAVTGFDAAGDPQIGGVPTWQTWDAAKTGLDDMIDQYRSPVTGRVVLDKMGRAINDVRKSMLTELDNVNPAYKEARASAGDYLSAQSAFDNGGKMLLNGNLPAQDFQAQFTKLTPAEQEAFKGGAANKLFNMAQNGQLGPKVFNRPIVQQKLSAVLGEQNAVQFLDSLQSEGAMQNFARLRVPGAGSPTAEYAAAMGTQDSPFNGQMADMTDRLIANHGNVKGALASKAWSKVGDAVSAWQTRGMPPGVRDQAGKLLLMHPNDASSILANMPKPLQTRIAPSAYPYPLLLSAQQQRQ